MKTSRSKRVPAKAGDTLSASTAPVALGSDAHSATSMHAATPAAAAAASWPTPAPAVPVPQLRSDPLDEELSAVKLRISAVEGEITGVEATTKQVRLIRDGCPLGSELRMEHTAELERLGREKEQLRRKEEQLRDEAKELRTLQRQSGTCILVTSAYGLCVLIYHRCLHWTYPCHIAQFGKCDIASKDVR